MPKKPKITIIDIISQLTPLINKEDHEGMKPVCEQINQIDMPHKEKLVYFAMFKEIGGVTQALKIAKTFMN